MDGEYASRSLYPACASRRRAPDRGIVEGPGGPPVETPAPSCEGLGKGDPQPPPRSWRPGVWSAGLRGGVVWRARGVLASRRPVTRPARVPATRPVAPEKQVTDVPGRRKGVVDPSVTPQPPGPGISVRSSVFPANEQISPSSSPSPVVDRVTRVAAAVGVSARTCPSVSELSSVSWTQHSAS